MSHDPYVLLDIRGLALRSLHSGTDRDGVTDSLTGRNINTAGHAVDNFVNTFLLEILKSYRLKQIIAVWDGGNEYRETLCEKEGFKEYKGSRKARERSPELEDAMKSTQESIKTLLKCLGITQVWVPGVEADDVIAWLVQKLPSNILIYTVDQDLLQLATEDAEERQVVVNCGNTWPSCYDDKKGNQVPYRYVALYKSMVGDTSDGYTGIQGFGPAAWTKLVETYGYENLHLIADAVSQKNMSSLRDVVIQEPGLHPVLEKILDQAGFWMSHWDLAVLHPELVNEKQGKGFNRPKWILRLPNRERLTSLLETNGCRHLVPVFQSYLPNPFILDNTDFNEEEMLAEARTLFAESPFVSIDWETSAPVNKDFEAAANGREVVDMLSSRITGAGFTFGRNLQHTFYATFDHAGSNNLPIGFLPKLLDCIPEATPKVAQNFYFERSVYTAQFGLELGNLHDTKIMASHVDEQETNGLKDLALRHLGYKQTRYSDVIEKGKAMRDYPVEHVFAYGADDPLVTAHLYEFFKLQMLIEGTWDFVRENEFPAVYQISDAYLAGINIDFDRLEELEAEDRKAYTEGMAKLRELIQTHQTPEHLEAGIENLLAYESEYMKANLAADPENLAKGLATMRVKVAERVTYVPYQKVQKNIEFKLTPTQLAKLTSYLDLPTFPEKLTKAAVKDWYLGLLPQYGDLPIGSDRSEFLRLIGENLDTLHTKPDQPSLERKLLIELCQKIALEAMDDSAYEWIGSELSLNSPKQMQALLYGMLALPIRVRSFDVSEERQKLNLEGLAQANEDAVLTAMATDTPEGDWRREALEALMKAKKADTRCKTFYAAYPLWKHPLTGNIHAQLNSVGTETRRMSGSAPNLMQLPKRGDGIKVREIILPSKGHDLIASIDWSGEELRVAAGLSLDDEMLSCYIDGSVLETLPDWMISSLGEARVKKFQSATLRDIHSLTASGIAKLSYEEFEAIRHDSDHPKNKEMKAIRGSAKAVNFLSQYGGGPTKLARKLICSPDIAKEYLSAKKKLYSGYEDWRGEMTALLHKQGYLTTLYGSHRHVFNKLNTSDDGMKGYLERSALNSLIQGVCADYLKVVLAKLWKAQTFRRHGAQFIAPIHDELVFSCHSSKAVALIQDVHSIMVEGIKGLPCPLTAEPSLGPNFGEQIEIGADPSAEAINQAISKALDIREAA